MMQWLCIFLAYVLPPPFSLYELWRFVRYKFTRPVDRRTGRLDRRIVNDTRDLHVRRQAVHGRRSGDDARKLWR